MLSFVSVLLILPAISLAAPSPAATGSSLSSNNTTDGALEAGKIDYHTACDTPPEPISTDAAKLCMDFITEWAWSLPPKTIPLTQSPTRASELFGTMPFRQVRRSEPDATGRVYTCDLAVVWTPGLSVEKMEDRTSEKYLVRSARRVAHDCVGQGKWGQIPIGEQGRARVQITSEWDRESRVQGGRNVTEFATS